MSATESRYVENRIDLPATLIEKAEAAHPSGDFGSEAEWVRAIREDYPKFIPFLTRHCGLDIRGRILEIGAGTGWFSAELSKLPPVVEIITTDVSSKLLKNEAPKMFKLLKANSAKITRQPAEYSKLPFPANHFDFVVCADALNRAVNVLRVLREVRRVLKPGGQFIAIREPVRPLMKFKSRPAPTAASYGYALSEYRHFFENADLDLTAKRVTLSRGVKYYFDRMVNGLTHARYAFVATKKAR